VNNEVAGGHSPPAMGAQTSRSDSIFWLPVRLVEWWFDLYAADSAYLYGYNKGPSQNFTSYIFGGPGSPQFLYTGPQKSKNCAFRPKLRASCAVRAAGGIFLSAL